MSEASSHRSSTAPTLPGGLRAPGVPQSKVPTPAGCEGSVRSCHLPEKFLVASMVVRIAPCNREEGVWGEEAGGGGRREAEMGGEGAGEAEEWGEGAGEAEEWEGRQRSRGRRGGAPF